MPLAGAVIEAMDDVVIAVGPDDRIRFASAATTRLLSRPARWLVGQPLAGLVHVDDRTRLAGLLQQVMTHGRARDTVDVRLSHFDGTWVDMEAKAAAMASPAGVDVVVVSLRDVRHRKAADAELRHLALHDGLTKLANRALFREHVERALAYRRHTNVRHAVLFVDLDGFKTINDSLGHDAGDTILVSVAERLRSRVRPGDTPARLGGDEFAVLLENTSERDAPTLAERILDVLRLPLSVNGKEVVLSGSIGIAFGDVAADADEVLRNADVAMYRAKAAGKGRYAVFRPEMHVAALQRLDLEADLRRAIDGEELELHYQPIVAMSTGEITGMEALVRWNHRTRGMLPPADFIPVAEDSGLIRPMGRLVLRQACAQVRRWHHEWPRPTPLRLSVNASVRQIEHDGFYDEVSDSLRETGFDPASLTLEITESLFLNDVQATVDKLWQLKGLGIKLAIDDFGTGYSSLSYLRSLPIDVLKIDRSFVKGVTGGPEQSAVARAIVKLARTFNLRTVAEGVEQAEQVTELVGIGCEMGQGYLFSRPVDAPTMGRLLATEGTAYPPAGP